MQGLEPAAVIEGEHRVGRCVRPQDRLRTLSLCVVALAGSGCFVVPKPVVKSTSLGVERSQPTVVAVGELQVRAADRDGTVVVSVQRERRCEVAVTEIYEDTKSMSATMDGIDPTRGCHGSDCLVMAALSVVIAPATLAVSGLITGIVVAASSDHTTRRTGHAHVERTSCPVPVARQPVELLLPTGARQEFTTDDDGRLAFEVPDDEPAEGMITVRARENGRELPALDVRYVQPRENLDRDMVMAAVTRARPLVWACWDEYRTKGTVTVRVEVGGDGAVASLDVLSTPDGRLGACVASAMRRATFPHTKHGGSFKYPFEFD